MENFDEKYDICFDKIKELRNAGKDWNEIKQIILSASSYYDVIFDNVKDYKDKIDSMIITLKHIEENTEKHTGYLYSDDVKNDIKISPAQTTAWNRFKNKCLKKYGLETEQNSQSSAIKIMERIKLESFNQEPGKGLVMGYVQSGKTMNIESVITLAADYGFNVFIMLSGTIENLRIQNLKRLQRDIDFSKNSNVQWKFFDNIKTPTASIDGLLKNNTARIVTVCLKNATRLKYLGKWLSTPSKTTKRMMKVIIIDDEADQASLNTKKITDEEQSRINKEILKMVNNKSFGAMNYISYTATPYGNFLNENSISSLYPQNFIVSLPKSSQYIGPSEIFGNRNDDETTDGLNIIEEITDSEYDVIKKMDKYEFEFPKSLEKAICWFICTLAIRRLKRSIDPVTMLIHTDSKQAIHSITRSIVQDWIKKNKEHLMEKCEEVYFEETSKISREDFLKVMTEYEDNKHHVEDYPDFVFIKKYIYEVLNNDISPIRVNEEGDFTYHKGIQIVIDNSDNRRGYDDNGNYIRLKYPEEGTINFAVGFIAIGGNTLARGLTLSGLTTSYFARNVNQVDTLLQMGRWFGYRTGYELLPRIWLTKSALAKFREIADIEERLRDDLKKYDLGVKPFEYAPKIQTSYITRFTLSSKNKMQGATQIGANYEKVDDQTVVFLKNKEIQKYNYDICIDFINNYLLNNMPKKVDDGNYVFNQIPYKEIKAKLLEKMKFYERDQFFGNIKFFFDWMEKEKNQDESWDIIIDNGKGELVDDVNKLEWRKTNRAKRTQSKDDVIDFGVIRNPKHRDNMYYYETGNKNGSQEDVKAPKLFIYMIDGNSKKVKNSTDDKKRREDLNFGQDIIALDLYVPNTGKRKATILTQKMKQEN